MARHRDKLLERITDWTTQYAQRQSRLSWYGCAGAAGGALPVLFITFWVIYAVLWIGFQGLLPGHGARLAGCGFVLILLFVGYATANWEYLQALKFDSSNKLMTARLAAYATGHSGFSLLAGPQTAHAFVKVISVTLLLGPGLIDLALRLAGRAQLLRELNIVAVAQSLTSLLEAEKRLTVEELAEGAAIDTDELMRNLSLVEGVVPLKSGELAVTLSESLQQELTDYRIAKPQE